MTSPAAGTGRDRPAIKWLAGYALVAAVVIFASGWRRTLYRCS